jgi:hypothetical protein
MFDNRWQGRNMKYLLVHNIVPQTFCEKTVENKRKVLVTVGGGRVTDAHNL